MTTSHDAVSMNVQHRHIEHAYLKPARLLPDFGLAVTVARRTGSIPRTLCERVVGLLATSSTLRRT